MGINEQSISAEKRQYYSSSQGPFHNANNILMFFGGGDRGEIVEGVIRSLREGRKRLTIGGEPGSGKTMMSLVLADRLKHRHNIIRFDLPQVSQALMLRHLLIEICPREAAVISADGEADARELRDGTARLKKALHGSSTADKPYLLIIDSQADIEPDCLRMLHSVLSRQSRGNPVLQILHFTPADQAPSVKDSSVEAARDKEDYFWLRRLTLTELGEYLRHHMMLFDFNQRDVFTRDMSYFIADRSEGVFRAVNTLARNAFMVASLEDAERVSMSHLLTAGLPAQKEPAEPRRFTVRHRRAIVCALGLSVLAVAAALVFTQV